MIKLMLTYVHDNRLQDLGSQTIESLATQFYNENCRSLSRKERKTVLTELENFDTYSRSSYTQYDDAELPRLIMTFSVFKPKLSRLLANKRNLRYKNFGILKRKVSQPLISKPNEIKPTNRSYGLLFE